MYFDCFLIVKKKKFKRAEDVRGRRTWDKVSGIHSVRETDVLSLSGCNDEPKLMDDVYLC